MTPGNWIALGSLIAVILIPIVIALVAHIRHDERRESRLETVEREIGSRDTGMRGTIHEHSNALTWLGGCVWYVANKLGIELPRRDK
jgi:hypothetical protein